MTDYIIFVGYNTIAFILNDFSDELTRSPHTVIWKLTNSMHSGQLDTEHKGEPMLNEQAIKVLPPFHSSTMNFFVAGGNSIEQLKVARFGKSDGRKTITLFLPDWWAR